jgi:BolA protein
MSLEARIREKLEAAFAPAELAVVNESHLHHGHHGSPGTGESHFRVRIVSETFRGLTRLARQRKVNEALSAELKGGIHALALTTLAPGEA